jgi:predicted TPR repeat methyltransferase
MRLELAVVLSCTGDWCEARYLDTGAGVRACRSGAMIEHDIRVRPGHLVVVDKRTDLPRVVYRWPDIVVAGAAGGSYALSRDGEPVDPDDLRADAFPEIEAMYARMEKAQTIDPRQVVQEGYDRIAERYLEWVRTDRSTTRLRYTQMLLDALPPGAAVLDLGCGAGGPTTEALAGRFQVTGVDISARSIVLARQNVPGAQFLQADMAELDFPAGSFDAVAAFYSIIHVPRDQQGSLFGRIASWLRPGGLLLATMGTHSLDVDYCEDYLGAPMYWSTFDSGTNRHMVEGAELEIVQAREETEEEDGQPVTFLWIVARKPAATQEGG